MSEDEPLEIEKAIILDNENPIRNVDVENKEVPVYGDLEAYIYDCSQGLAAIGSAIEKVKISMLMLEKAREYYPSNTPYNESEYIEYAIENFYIRSTGLYDRCLIFTGKLLNLGIASESINHVLIVTNEHAIEKGLSDLLKKIGKACRELSTERNNIIHHGRYNEESFNTVSAIHKVNQLKIAQDEEAPFDMATIDHFTQKAINEKLIDFRDYFGKIEKAIRSFYDASLPVYFEMKTKLRAH
jgi:hypothetical protein